MSKDDKIISSLRAARKGNLPVDIAVLLDSLAEGGLTQGSLVTYFKRAFPEIPLKVLISDATDWSRVGSGDMTDEDFNALLLPWLDNEEGKSGW